MDTTLINLNPQIIELINSDPLFKKDHSIDQQTYKNITFLRLKKIVETGIINARQIGENPDVFLSVMNVLHLYDASLAIKTGVNFGLFGGSICKCGEPEQVNEYLNKLNRGEIFGCLAITEIGHGSNLKGLETTSHYDPHLDCFIINSPTPSSKKCWIGNAAYHGTHAVVFAQLIMPGNVHKGLHPFLVQIRNPDDMTLMKGITITDNGMKKGLNGIDNGMIEFRNVVISKEMILRKFGYVNQAKEYVYYCEEHEKESVRFSSLLATLSGGRGVLAFGANIMSLKVLKIAISYASKRRQFRFNGADQPEKRIIEYSTHYTNLIPLLAKSMIMQDALVKIKNLIFDEYRETGGQITKNAHTLSSGIKILASEHCEKCCRIVRVLCGGHGYASVNEISLVHNDVDIYQTFEGDNTLLRQEVSKNILMKFFNYTNQSLSVLELVRFQLEKKLRALASYITDVNINRPEDMIWLLKYLVKYQVYQIVKNIMCYVWDGCKETEAWNRVLPDVMILADNYMHYKMARLTIHNRYSSLYIYSIIMDNSTWFITNNLLSPNKIDHINEKIKRISRRFSKEAIDLNLPFTDVPMLHY